MYEIRPHPEAAEQIAALPRDVREGYDEAAEVMRLVPWNGEPVNDANPDGAVRQLWFGSDAAGLVTYLVLEDLRRVDVISVVWLD